jgi:hypothetical protein
MFGIERNRFDLMGSYLLAASDLGARSMIYHFGTVVLGNMGEIGGKTT